MPQESGNSQEDFKLDEEHARMLEEAHKQPGIREAEELYQPIPRWDRTPPSYFLPIKPTRTLTSTEVTRPNPWVRT